MTKPRPKASIPNLRPHRKRKQLRTRADRIIAFIERYCRVPEGKHVGKPMVLDSFQTAFIRAVYDNPVDTTRAILSMGRKNGKTALIAALVLAHLVGPEAQLNSQICSGAMSKDQAALVFKLAEKMISLNDELREIIRIVPSGKHLFGIPLNTEYQALAADGSTAQGLSPILAILDEVGQVRGPRSEFIDAITTAQGAHDAPLVIVISTQAPNDADLLSIWIDDALTGADPSLVVHLYAAPKDAALDDREAWAAANPAMGTFRSEADVAKQARAAKRMPSSEPTFRNLILNQRVQAHSPFMSRSVWESCRATAREPIEGETEVFAGLDLSAVADLTAYVETWREPEGTRIGVRAQFWTPEEGLEERAKRDRAPYDVWVRDGYITATPGAVVDYDFVARFILERAERINLRLVAFDRWRFEQMKSAMKRQGASDQWLEEHMVAFSQGFQGMAPALDAVEAAALSRALAHGGSPVLTMCAANAVVTRDAAGNRKLDKAKATGRIDGMVALAMAECTRTKNSPKENEESFCEAW